MMRPTARLIEEKKLRGNPPEIARGIEAAFAAEAGSGPIPAGRRPSF
jgi:hypothetical protein